MGHLERIELSLGFKQARQPLPVVERKGEVVDRLTGKIGKQDATYRAARRSDKASCAECEHYLFPGNPSSNCRRVAGLVYADDVCDLYVSRTTEHGEGQGQQVQPPTSTDR